MNDYRHVCFKDLENYFKKSDYFDGLSDQEMELIRTNLDVPSTKDLTEKQGGVVELTYEELKLKVDESNLNTYCTYVITDFRTIYESNVEVNGVRETWGTETNHPSTEYSIVLNPISKNQFSQNVEILEDGVAKNWIVRYDFNQETLSDGTLTKGKIIYLQDEHNNSAYYDFKNIRFRVYLNAQDVDTLPSSGNYDLYTFSYHSGNKFIENSQEAYNNTFEVNCYENVFLGETVNNVFYGGFKNNIFTSDCKYNKFEWNTSGNKFTSSITYAQGSIQDALVKTSSYDSAISKEFKMLNNQSGTSPIFVVTTLDADTLTTQISIIELNKR